MVDIIGFGEAMLRLSPKNFERIEFANEFDIKVGGTEVNFCIALKRLGYNTGWISKLTDNLLGKRIENEIKRWGVDTSQIIWTKKYRVGIYFYERGSYPRPSKIIYDRKNSAICYIENEEINWNYLQNAKLFHTTGITLALSNNCFNVALECLKFMKNLKKITSFDINYRSKLWNIEEAKKYIEKILPFIDILFCSEQDLQLLFGNKDIEIICDNLLSKYDNEIIVITRRSEKSIAIDKNKKKYYGIGFKPDLVDRIGAGDAFDAGFIHGYLKNKIELGLQYGEAMAALKFSVPGDFAIITEEEIENCLKMEKLKGILR